MKLTKTIMSVLLLGGVALSASGSITVHDSSGATKVYGDDVTKIVFDNSDIFDVTGSDPAREETKQIVVNRSCTLILKNINLKNTRDGVSSVEVNGNATLNLRVDGKNIISSGHGAAGILVTENAKLVLDHADKAVPADAVLYVSCGQNGAAIGAAGPYGSPLRSVNAGTIIVNGATIVTRRSDARGTYWCDGLGDAYRASAKSVEIDGGTLDIQTPGGICAQEVVFNGGTVRVPDLKYGIQRSVNGSRKIAPPVPVNKKEEPLVLAKIPLDTGILGDKGFKVEFQGESYGTRDIFPIDDPQSHGKSLYLYLTKVSHRFTVSEARGTVDYTIGWNGSGFTAKSTVTLKPGVLVDGVLTDGERPIANTSATASVTVAGQRYDLAFTTDERGVFVVTLPVGTIPSSVVLDNVKVGGKTTTFTATLSVPRLPYALGADAAGTVVSDSDTTVVDDQVTVTGDLFMGQGAKVSNTNLLGGVKGGITVGQPSPAKEYALELDKNRDVGNTAVHWIGEPIPLLDAHVKGKHRCEVDSTVPANMYFPTRSIYLYLSKGKTDPIKKKYSDARSWHEFDLSDVKNFGFGELTKEKSFREPGEMGWPDFVEGKPDWENVYAYTAQSDGFMVVEITMPENSLGGVAVTMDFNEGGEDWQRPFGAGWHRGPFPAPQENGGVFAPAFHRVYTYPMRKGATMHMRLLWESIAGHPGLWSDNYITNREADTGNRKKGYSVIDLKVTVTFYPFGG